MKVHEIILESSADVKHKLAYQSGKQKLADRAGGFGYKAGVGLIRYDEAGRAQPFKPVDAVKLKAGKASISLNRSMANFNKNFVSNRWIAYLTIFIAPTTQWIEDCAGINALYEAGAFPQETAKQEAQDLISYYTHIWLSRMATGLPAWLASVAGSRAVMWAVSKLLSKFGLWGKILALPAGLVTQAAVIKALQSESVQHWFIAKIGYFGAEAADLVGWIAPAIPKEWTNITGAGIDAVKSLFTSDEKAPGSEPSAKPSTGEPSAKPSTGGQSSISSLLPSFGKASAQDLIKQLG